MGSCLGTNAAPAPAPPQPKTPHGSKSPPPVVYEESVKEVLSVSQTPTHRLLPIPTFPPNKPLPLPLPRRNEAAGARTSPGNGRNTGLERRSRLPASDPGSSRKTVGNYPGRMEFGSGRKGKEAQPAPTTNELLETSLVSLECFIFL